MTEVVILRPTENMQTIIITMIPTTNVQEYFAKFLLVKSAFQIFDKKPDCFCTKIFIQ